MTRRGFLGSLAPTVAAVSACAMGSSAIVTAQEQRYGTITADNCLRMTGRSSCDAVVFLNGRKVENKKVLALNEQEGWIEVIERVNGEMRIDPATQRIARVRHFGHVELRFKERA